MLGFLNRIKKMEDLIEKNYTGNLKTFEELCHHAAILSDENAGRKTSDRKYWGSIIFSKICLTAIGVLRFLPDSVFYTRTNNLEIWDISSICILSRSLIDAYYVFFYLAIDNISDDEFTFRLILWELHSVCERLSMLKLIKSKISAIPDLIQEIDRLKERLKHNAYYRELRTGKKDKFISGKYGLSLDRNQISKKVGINVDYANMIYKDLSQYVHSYTISISVLNKLKPGSPDFFRLATTIICHCICYMWLSIRDFQRLFPDQGVSFSPQTELKIGEAECIMEGMGK